MDRPSAHAREAFPRRPSPIPAHLCRFSLMNPTPSNDDEDVRKQLAKLRQEHRDLDTAIEALFETGRADHLQIQRLKKKKLALKDRIISLEDQMLPDIIA